MEKARADNFHLLPSPAMGIHFIDGSVGFLTSPNGTFRAAILSPGGQGGTMTLSVTGIVLTEAGNLMLLDQSDAVLWESFNYPTDTIVMGQKLPVGGFLSSAVSSSDLSVGSYWLSITASDALLQWKNLTYWKLSMNTGAYTTSSYPVEYMAMNQTGLYLLGNNGSQVVIQVNLSVSDFGIAKLDYSGQFSVSNFSGGAFNPIFAGPDDKCQIPFICGTLGLCSDDADNPVCSCPSNFHPSSQSQNPPVCVPSDSYSLPNSCISTDTSNTGNSLLVSFLSLGYGIDYFSNNFTSPVKYGVNLSVCEDLCSSDCSCLGIFYDNSSNSCYVLQNQLGSLMSNSSSDRLGFVKAIVGPSPANSGQALGFPIVALVLLPFFGFFLLATLGFFLWRRLRSSKTVKLNLNNQTIPSSEELDAFSIPGLPVRFGYEELEAATDKFKTMIGSGGGYSSTSSGRGLVYFPMFALEMHEQGRYLELADPKLEGRVSSEDVEKLVRVALCCAHEDPALRPSMVSVVSMLEGEIPSGQPKLESLNFLRFYGRRFGGASTKEESNNGQVDFTQ
ncbi:hypothetical protein C3L33_11332, partial [Rhododendron williamsianum]